MRKQRMRTHRVKEKISLKEQEAFRETQWEQELADTIQTWPIVSVPAKDQNFPNRNVNTPDGPLRSAFVAAGESTPETYR